MHMIKYGLDWMFETWPGFVKHGYVRYNTENNAIFVLSRYHYYYYCQFQKTMNT